MSKNKTGNFIAGGKPQVPSLSSNNGIFDTKDVYTATNNNAWQEPDGYYEIKKSLRCRYSTTGSLIKNSNLPTPTNSSKWTVSMWVKRGNIAANTNQYNSLFGKTVSVSANFALYFGYSGSDNRDNITWTFDNTYSLQTSQLFRDVGGWYHFVFVWDSANSIATERAKIYVNGVQITQFSTDGRAQITTSKDCWNTTNTGYTGAIGATSANASTPNSSVDGQIAEFINVDGQVLDPSYFGYFDPVTNIWQPKPYTGSYGNAGGYYNFSESTSTLNLGRNLAGANYFTYSEQFDNAAWSKYQSSVTANATTAPDGTVTADKLVGATGTTGDHQVSQSNMVTAADNATYTFSCYAKAAERSIFRLYIQKRDGSTYAYGDFDLTAGQIYTLGGGPYAGAIPTITFVGNGWYRCAITVNIGTGAGGVSAIVSYASPGAETAGYGLYIWGAQINLGTTVDSYIQTVASSKSNDWSPYGLSVANDATNDSLVDSPTNINTTATDVGGVVTGNYCTLSAVDKASSTNLINAGLTADYYPYANSSNAGAARGTLGIPTSGKWYYEFSAAIQAGSGNSCYSVLTTSIPGNLNATTGTAWHGGINYIGVDVSVYNNALYFKSSGWSTSTADSSTLWATYAANDICSLAIDFDAGKIWVAKNGSWYNSGNPAAGTNATSSFTAPTGTVFPHVEPITSSNNANRANITVNFGQRPFAYTPPAGFKTINTTNLQALGASAVSKVGIQANKWFDVSLYGGTGVSQTITNSGFQPDMVWTKTRYTTNGSHVITDSARGTTIGLFPNVTNVESADGTSYVTSFNSNGFNVNAGTGSNGAGDAYAAWQWKQSPSAGLNIISYTGNGVNNRAITHNLGVTPAFIIVKARDISYNWDIYHKDLGIGATLIFTTAATRNYSAFGSTAPNSSNFYTQDQFTNTNGNKYVAYVWAEVPGFSKFGSYIANASADGPFVNCGFKPKFVIIKAPNMIQEWVMLDSTRTSSIIGNPVDKYFMPNASNAESTGDDVDFLSNGFKIRVSGSGVNYNSGQTYLYAAFAESPFALNNRAR